MKPWPKAIRDRYPLGRYQVSERPWWSQDIKAENDYRFVRTDRIGIRDADAVTVTADILRYDTTNPLPRPPYRVGQVWADEHGHAVMLTTVYGDMAWWADPQYGSIQRFDDNPLRYPYLVSDPHVPSAAPWSPPETL